MLPKKVKKNINLSPVKTGYDRRVELFEKISQDGTFLPKSVLYEDLDRGFLDFVRNNLKTVVDGKNIPVVDILVTSQNWTQFTQTWDFKDIDKNVKPPFVTTIRTPEIKFGTNPALKYNIPNRKQYYYAAVPNWSGQRHGIDVYTIPQPVPVDITYSVKIICNRMRELNSFNKTVIEKFSSRQSYTNVKGHYIPIVLNEVSDESVMDIEKRKYYIQSFSFNLQGFIIDENEFEVKPAVSRMLQIFEVDTSRKFKKVKRFPENINKLSFNVSIPVGETTYENTFEYTANLQILTPKNILSVSYYINDLFYGSSVNKEIQINTNDTLRIDIVKNNVNNESSFIVDVKLI
jgi:hypothetical protein